MSESPKSAVSLKTDIITVEEEQLLFKNCINLIKWRQEGNRQTAYFGDVPYSYGNVTHKKQTLWPPFLKNLLQDVNQENKTTYNSILLNHYPNEKSGLNFHKDDERGIDVNHPIATFLWESLGHLF